MRNQNNHLEAFLSKIGELKVDFFPYSLEEELMDLELIENIQLLLNLHKEIHRYKHYLESIINYVDDDKCLNLNTASREREALNRNHYRISKRIRELRGGRKH